MTLLTASNLIRRRRRRYEASVYYVEYMIRESCPTLDIVEARAQHIDRFFNPIDRHPMSLHQLNADGFFLSTAITLNRPYLAFLLLTQYIDSFEAFTQLPDQRQNFLSLLESSKTVARYYYYMYFRQCYLTKLPYAYTVDSLHTYCRVCSITRPLTSNVPREFCSCYHCCNYLPYVAIIINKMINDPRPATCVDRARVFILFLLFGMDVGAMKFSLSSTGEILDLLTYFIFESFVGNKKIAIFEDIFHKILADYQTVSYSKLVSKHYMSMLAKFFKPEEVWCLTKTPLSLQHQCRCVVRKVFREANGLPYGVMDLTCVPRLLREYINLSENVWILNDKMFRYIQSDY